MSAGAGKGDGTRQGHNPVKFGAGYDRIFGKRRRRPPAGKYRVTADGALIPYELIKCLRKKCDNKHFRSKALGCHPKQIPAWTKKYGDLGIKFDPTNGDAILPTRQAKLAMMKRRGQIDFDEVRSGKHA